MKIRYLFLSLLTCCVLVGCQQKSNTITVTGQLEGVEDSTVITLGKIENRMFVDLASDTVIDGKFKFTLVDSSNQTKPMTISAQGKGFPPTWLSLWAGSGDKIQITGKDKMLRSWMVKSNNPLQKELNTFNDRTRDYEHQTQLIMKEAYAQFDSMRAMPDRSTEFRARIDSLYALNDSLNNLMLKAEIDLLGEKKTYSDLWIEKLDFYSMRLRFMPVPEDYTEKMRSLYDAMPEELKKSEKGESIYLSLNLPKVVDVGDDMADADMWDLDGNLQRLENFKGKYILLDFWSSGCGPCIMSMPEMKEVSETYKDKLTVVSISSDSKEVWEKISKEKNITWVNLNDFKGDNGIKLNYGVKGIPHYVMIAPDGKVATSWMGYGEGYLKQKVKEVIQ